MTHSRTPRRLRRQVVFKGRIFQVERDRVRLSNGRVVDMEIVRHEGSVVLIAQPSRDSLILIRQYRYVIGRWIWELPAGSLDPGERPSAAARRECAEETGLVPGRVRRLRTLYPTPGFVDERMIFFQCTELSRPRRPLELDEDELLEPRTFTVAEVRRMIARGQIVDMKTIVGLAMMEHSEL
jgi:ADP-ribose pyrophosphatase